MVVVPLSPTCTMHTQVHPCTLEVLVWGVHISEVSRILEVEVVFGCDPHCAINPLFFNNSIGAVESQFRHGRLRVAKLLMRLAKMCHEVKPRFYIWWIFHVK